MKSKLTKIVKYGSKWKANQELNPEPKVAATLPPVTSLAKVLKIVIFPHGKEVGLSQQSVGTELTILRACQPNLRSSSHL